jgi:hypothetical protein
MRNLIMISILILFSKQICAQQLETDKFEVILHHPLSISFDDIDELLSPKILPNAIELRVGLSNPSRVLATLRAPTEENSTSFDYKIKLKPNRNTSPYPALISPEVALSSSRSSLLFTDPHEESGVGYYSIFYDVIIDPLENFIQDPQFDFEINFIITTL